MDSAGERFEAIRAALADRNNILTVKDLYELAGVSRSGYYNWVRSEKNRELREAKDRAAFEQILEAYRFRGYAKGVRGIHIISFLTGTSWGTIAIMVPIIAPLALRQRRRAKHGSLCRRCNNPRRRNLWRPLLPHFEHHHSLLLGCRIGPHCTCKNTASLCSNLCCNWLHRVFDYWPHTVILCSTKCTAVLIEPPYK